MEEAHLKRFLDSTTMFSLIYKNYEKDLKKELWLCHKYMNLTMDEIDKMRISDRKYFIKLHNQQVEKEKQEWNKRKK